MTKEWRPLPWYRRIRHYEGMGASFLCLLGIHDWRYNCNGYTLDEWEECSRCKAMKHD